MGAGWENARYRGDGNDWATFALGVRGIPNLVEVDTSYFIGNAPDAVQVSVADADAGPVEDPNGWWDVVPRRRVQVDTRHRFLVAVERAATHLRLDVYPDGGLTRLRCYGEIPADVAQTLRQRFWDTLPRRAPALPRRPGALTGRRSGHPARGEDLPDLQ